MQNIKELYNKIDLTSSTNFTVINPQITELTNSMDAGITTITNKYIEYNVETKSVKIEITQIEISPNLPTTEIRNSFVGMRTTVVNEVSHNITQVAQTIVNVENTVVQECTEMVTTVLVGSKKGGSVCCEDCDKPQFRTSGRGWRTEPASRPLRKPRPVARQEGKRRSWA